MNNKDELQDIHEYVKKSMELMIDTVEKQSDYFRQMQHFQNSILDSRIHTLVTTLLGTLCLFAFLIIIVLSTLPIAPLPFGLLCGGSLILLLFTIKHLNRAENIIKNLYGNIKDVH